MVRLAVFSLWLACALAAQAGEPGFKHLSGAAIKATIIGKTVTDDAHWADRFLADGTLEGHALGKPAPGSWIIERGELCLSRPGKPPTRECYEIWMRGNEIEYRQYGVAVATGQLRE